MTQANPSPQSIARSLIKHGYAVVEPPHELRVCFDEIERCSTLLRRKQLGDDAGVVHFGANGVQPGEGGPASQSPVPVRSQEPTRHRRGAQRACAVAAAVNAAWNKATGSTKPYDLTATLPLGQAPALAVPIAVQFLREHFEWIEAQDLEQHATAQDLVDHILRIEASQRQCWELLSVDHTPRPEDDLQELETHTHVRSVQTRMQWCGRRACAMLDGMCRDAFRECLPDIESLLADRSPLEPARPPAHLGSVLTLHTCPKSGEGDAASSEEARPNGHKAAGRQQGTAPRGNSLSLSPQRERRSAQVAEPGAFLDSELEGDPEAACWTGDMEAQCYGLLSAFYSKRETAIELQDKTGQRTVRLLHTTSGSYVTLPLQKIVPSQSLIFVVGRTLEAATTIPSLGMYQTRQNVSSHRVVLQGRKRNEGGSVCCHVHPDCTSFAYELHAHPNTFLNPEEYGRVALGKSTPPLFREIFSVAQYFASDPWGRLCSERIQRLGLFPTIQPPPSEDREEVHAEQEGGCGGRRGRRDKGEAKHAGAGVLGGGGGETAAAALPLVSGGGDTDSLDASGGGESDCMEEGDGDGEEGGMRLVHGGHVAGDDGGGGGSSGQCLARLDVALLIMSNLDTAMVCRASTVCQVWRQACYNITVWRDVDLSPFAALVTDRALAQMAGRLRHTRTLNLSGCVHMTDSGIEALLGDSNLPFKRAEKESWEREAPEHRLHPSWYGREVVIKGHRFRVYGFGKDEDSGRAFVRGRTRINEEVRVGLDHVRNSLINSSADEECGVLPPAACTAHAPISLGDCADCARERDGRPACLKHVVIQGCRLVTIRGARMLEGSQARVEGLPGPVTICVEAEGDIAHRRLIFFKIRGNQPLKRLLRAYLSSAFLTNPDTPLEFYFQNQIVYAHDTAQALGLQDADVVKAALPRIRICVCGVGSFSRRGVVEVTVRASERIAALVHAYQILVEDGSEVQISTHQCKFSWVDPQSTPAQLNWGDMQTVWAFPVGRV